MLYFQVQIKATATMHITGKYNQSSMLRQLSKVWDYAVILHKETQTPRYRIPLSNPL